MDKLTFFIVNSLGLEHYDAGNQRRFMMYLTTFGFFLTGPFMDLYFMESQKVRQFQTFIYLISCTYALEKVVHSTHTFLLLGLINHLICGNLKTYEFFKSSPRLNEGLTLTMYLYLFAFVDLYYPESLEWVIYVIPFFWVPLRHIELYPLYFFQPSTWIKRIWELLWLGGAYFFDIGFWHGVLKWVQLHSGVFVFTVMFHSEYVPDEKITSTQIKIAFTSVVVMNALIILTQSVL